MCQFFLVFPDKLFCLLQNSNHMESQDFENTLMNNEQEMEEHIVFEVVNNEAGTSNANVPKDKRKKSKYVYF